MGTGTSIVLIAVGAILKYAVSADAPGLDVETTGTILLTLGVVGVLISVIFSALWSARSWRGGGSNPEELPPR